MQVPAAVKRLSLTNSQEEWQDGCIIVSGGLLFAVKVAR
jgi:hypothetical protein